MRRDDRRPDNNNDDGGADHDDDDGADHDDDGGADHDGDNDDALGDSRHNTGRGFVGDDDDSGGVDRDGRRGDADASLRRLASDDCCGRADQRDRNGRGEQHDGRRHGVWRRLSFGRVDRRARRGVALRTLRLKKKNTDDNDFNRPTGGGAKATDIQRGALLLSSRSRSGPSLARVARQRCRSSAPTRARHAAQRLDDESSGRSEASSSRIV